ncbi:germin-like protein subfamily T member 2 [Camellia sinensis]|uniref:germin-like protein subfamily T member 2 n=1 Tax=Camellia sinensis TaxID=4442 RepID=UPI001036E8A6|nr:germin-like protein subfamily T member 2 [Camellia sinensis]
MSLPKKTPLKFPPTPHSTTTYQYQKLAMITLFLIALLVSSIPFSFADPDPLQDFCIADLEAQPSINGFPCKPASSVTSDDFFFDGLSKEGNTGNVFGANVTAGNVRAFPGLNTLGLSMNRVDLAPGAVNPPHIHPRSTELVLVIKGKLLVGFVTTGNVFHSKVVTRGKLFVIPRGLVHFQKNVGKGKALAFTAFDSQLPGVVNLPLTLFGSTPPIPNDVLIKGFQVDEDVVKGIKSKFGN